MNLYNGSYGENVKKLQTALNKFGYGLDVDGGYGPKTEAAVRDYQTKYNLRIDGVVGNETWGSLANQTATAAPTPQTSASVLSGVSQETTDALGKLQQGYAPSEATSAAAEKLESINAAKPSDFTSKYDDELQALYEKIAGREKFSYDPGKDAAFQQYTDQYTRQGRAAMEDTMGKTAALSGGYASSYAQTAGQQTYQGYLQQLYDLLPQLQANAQSQYNREGEALTNQYDLLKDQDTADYSRWRDTVSDWENQSAQAYKEYAGAQSADADSYKLLLNYYADKAAAEQKAAPEGSRNNTGAAAKSSNSAALSSVAYGSLSGAMGNYLKSGSYDRAAALLRQYEGRMTDQQKQSAAVLFRKYGYQA